jgi:hypothetical protein
VLRIAPGRLVRVEQKNSLRLEGPLRYTTVGSLALGPDSSFAPMAFASIRALHVRGLATGTGTAVGGLLGAATGLAVGVGATTGGFVDEENEEVNVAALTAGGALTGAAVGGLIGTRFLKWHERYRAEE